MSRGHRIVGPLATPQFERHWVFTTIAVISVVLSIASAAVSYMQQQQAAEANARNQKAQMDAQDAAIKENAALANRAYMEKSKALQDRQSEMDAAAVAEEQDVSLQAAQARSTAVTAAGEAGVSGLSVNALLDDYTGQEARFRFQSRTNLEGQRSQTERELEGAQMEGQGRVQSMKPYQLQPVQYPSLLGAGLRIGAAAAQGYRSYSKDRPQTPQTPNNGGSRYYGDSQEFR